MPDPVAQLTGPALAEAFALAAAHLAAAASAIDAINVYPVPDGDTGTNMSGTLSGAVAKAATDAAESTAESYLTALARAALRSARGNSGVILSQALRGLATAAAGGETIDAAGLATALDAAAKAAYTAVTKPVEGTMLTVLRKAAEGAAGSTTTPRAVLEAAVAAAEAAEAETINQLPALTEAGVTDSGGEGVCTILRALAAWARGDLAVPAPVLVPGRPLAMLAGHGDEQYGFCVEFVVEAKDAPLGVERIRELVSAGTNRSVVVVGDETAIHAHVHTDAPDDLLELAATFGSLVHTKAEDMSAQHVRFRASGSGAPPKLALLALSRGDGFDRIFAGAGAAVADLGLVAKPPAGDIAAAADALGSPAVIVLPNHKNVVLAALQARELTKCRLHVVETHTLPQGIAAALAFNAEFEVEENLAVMASARSSLSTVEVTEAAASRTADGVAVQAGDAIALVDDRLVASATSPVEALLSGLRAAEADDALVTLYAGAGVDAGELVQARTLIANAFPGAELEVHDGGQPLYRFIASVER